MVVPEDSREDVNHIIALRKQAALISLLVGGIMLFLKTTAYLLTNSSAILSDALESIIHVAATAMAFYSVIVSARPADDSHPYGHGKVEFLSAGIEGGLITLAAVAILVEAIRGIVLGKTLLELQTGVILIVVASFVNLGLGIFLIRRGKKTSSLTLVADGQHVLTDSYTSFGVIIGLVLVRLTGAQILDPLVAIGVALNILYAGYKLVRTSVGGLMDESDSRLLDRLVQFLGRNRVPEWITIHHLRVMRSGDFHHIDFHLTIPFYWSVDQGHRFQESVATRIRDELSNRASVLVHIDPCTHEYCAHCRVDPCIERGEPFQKELPWTVAALTGNPPIFDPDES